MIRDAPILILEGVGMCVGVGIRRVSFLGTRKFVWLAAQYVNTFVVVLRRLTHFTWHGLFETP